VDNLHVRRIENQRRLTFKCRESKKLQPFARGVVFLTLLSDDRRGLNGR
jgi:hypothetical protein